MIRKLQRKFILLSMGSFALVLIVIISAINIVNYSTVVREADQLLEILQQNQGRFPMDHGNKPGRLPPGMSPEIPYETRYFSVTLDARNGSVIQAETSRIVSVDTSQAIDYAQQVLSQARNQGFVDNFRYCVLSEDLFVRITFLDWGRKLDACRGFLLASLVITLIGYLAVFGLIAFFSNRITRPISESHEKQKRFITDAGHELKTPLTIISADADVLELEIGENEWLQDIQKQARRLTALTNDLVLLSRMEEAEKSLPMIDFPFSDVVSEAAASFHSLAQSQNKVFRCQVQPLLSLHGNEKSIHQLVTILLDNALKYTPKKGTISLAAESSARGIRLTVYNTTQQEISQENLSLLFDRFYRADPSRNSQTGGHGIGLSIAKAIVTAHNGNIQAAIQDHHSLTIRVLFPG